MSYITTCPRCSSQLRVSEQITDKTLICPYCLANVNNLWPGSQIRFDDINTDVKRDMGAGGIILAVLIGLCLLGMAIAPFVPFLFLGVILVLGIIIIIVIVRSSTRGDASGAPLSAESTLGRAFQILFLVLGTIVAIVIFVFFVCVIAISRLDIKH